MTTVLFPGRWSPPHDGHVAAINEAIQAGHSVIIGIRDTKKDRNNPFSYRWRRRRFKRLFGRNSVSFVRIPDPDCDLQIWIGRNVGFKVVQLSKDLEDISATEIREEMRQQGLL